MALRLEKLINWPNAMALRLLFAVAILNVSIGGAVLLDANPVCFAPDGAHAVEQHLVPVQLFTIFQVAAITQPQPVKHWPVPSQPEPAPVKIHSSDIFATSVTFEFIQNLKLLEYTGVENLVSVASQPSRVAFPSNPPRRLNPYLSVPQKPPAF